MIPDHLFVAYLPWFPLIRASVLWFAAIAILVGLLLAKTNFGNWVRATGGFLPAAQAMGIPTARVTIACFMTASVPRTRPGRLRPG